MPYSNGLFSVAHGGLPRVDLDGRLSLAYGCADGDGGRAMVDGRASSTDHSFKALGK